MFRNIIDFVASYLLSHRFQLFFLNLGTNFLFFIKDDNLMMQRCVIQKKAQQ